MADYPCPSESTLRELCTTYDIPWTVNPNVVDFFTPIQMEANVESLIQKYSLQHNEMVADAQRRLTQQPEPIGEISALEIAPDPEPKSKPDPEPSGVKTTEAEPAPEYDPMKFTNRVRELLTRYGFEVPDSDEPEDLIAVIRVILDRVERDPNRQEVVALLAANDEQEPMDETQEEFMVTLDQDDTIQGILKTGGRSQGGRVTFENIELPGSE
jgi:hypothetical protein